MRGWAVPPPREPRKSAAELEAERIATVRRLERGGYLSSERIRRALLTVPREEFIPREYRDYAYREVPLPLPGKQATISCPHSYPLFYEPLGLDEGHRFLEVGTGSGYGAAVAREVVGAAGLVVSVEIDPVTLAFARENLERMGYGDVVLVRGDGAGGHPDRAPYDRIAVTAACAEVPPSLIEQLRPDGRLVVPILEEGTQVLTVLERTPGGLRQTPLTEVLYMSLRSPP